MHRQSLDQVNIWSPQFTITRAMCSSLLEYFFGSRHPSNRSADGLFHNACQGKCLRTMLMIWLQYTEHTVIIYFILGVESGLSLTLNVEQYEYMTGPHNSAGIKLLLNEPDQTPFVYGLGQAVPTGTHGYFGIKFMMVSRSSLLKRVHHLISKKKACDSRRNM